ncbi:MAG: 8-amino-7-oxononanoate synthase [Bacteroidota bacterium]
MDENFLQEYLTGRAKDGTLRALPAEKAALDFLSNDYLGMSRDPQLQHRIDQAWRKDDHQLLGGTGSRLLSGNHPLYETLEEQLCEVFQSEAVLVFNSGYQANQSLIVALGGRQDVVLYDELSHVCLKEGAWLSQARSFAFRHNDIEDLKRRLRTLNGESKRIFVVTETLFSMDGDFAPIAQILEACEAVGAYLIVDEAHSTGVYGERGGGWLIERGMADRVFARVYTFGKAIGSHGACVAGSKLLVDYLVNAGRGFIYTTSLPPHALRTLIEVFGYLPSQPGRVDQLMRNIEYFRDCYATFFGDHAKSHSAIQPIPVPGAERCAGISATLRKEGYSIMAIRAPTVRAGQERLRVCLHSYNTPKEIEGLLRSAAALIMTG